MKIHTTNYFDTFIEVADDTKAEIVCIPAKVGQVFRFKVGQFWADCCC